MEGLVAFIDGKLWKIPRPARFQQVMYSGHKRIHGIKTQGLVFPNGVQPYPFGPVNGARHDSYVLRQSEVLEMMDEVETMTGTTYRLFGDSAYPQHKHLWAMYKEVPGHPLAQWQLAFNADMSPECVTVEWGFGKIVTQCPFVDFRAKMKVLLSPIGLYLEIANIITNMHTCLMGSAVSRKYGLGAPSLHAYMSGNGKH